MAVTQGSLIVLVLSIALTVDYARSQHYGEREQEWEGGGTAPQPTAGMSGTTDMMMMSTASAAAGEPAEPTEAAEPAEGGMMTTTTVATTTKKPKPRRRPKTRKRRPKNLKPKPNRKGPPGRKAVKPARKPVTTTPMPTQAPTLAPTTRRATQAPTQAPIVTVLPVHTVQQPVAGAATLPVQAQAQGTQGGGQYAASANAAAGPAGAAYAPEVKVVPQGYQVTVRATPAPTTKSPNQYLYEPHSCPKMDVATWENEVVIYDNKNCAIIVRMNPRLRRPTVTFQAPYW